ncbi:pyridoxamine 5'-phosphate oxidase family protein [Candidatus Halobonum tyrrellensis]|uniref:Flavin-nucleotide-binding protein n=1 Tax=Candidatus Halobonum tyrrellensis G22 TaxID=1324957 RepID=V4J0Y3_9EURY|nr:pyridoxamine 5'-phosphate oxidase family protein [Candidatus Halobonum tyrrellensis]ESP89122.1 flavin-nucleotide-binding protein [Candidatus Halobonum tyrrellensis G22]
MPTDTYGQWIGTPMDDADVDAVLESSGWGVVSLADGDEPYSLPLSFGYDGENVYLAFIRTGSSNRKFEFAAEGKPARLLVTDVSGRFDWESVAVTGTLRAVDRDGEEWETLIETLDDNAWFTAGFERAAGYEELRGWRLEPDEVRGLQVRPDEG